MKCLVEDAIDEVGCRNIHPYMRLLHLSGQLVTDSNGFHQYPVSLLEPAREGEMVHGSMCMDHEAMEDMAKSKKVRTAILFSHLTLLARSDFLCACRDEACHGEFGVAQKRPDPRFQ